METTPRRAARCQTCGGADMRSFCPDCGQAAWPGRLTLRRAIHDLFGTLTDLDARVPRTLIDLTVRPGSVARDQIEGRTVRHVTAFKYLLLVAAAVTVLSIVGGAAKIERLLPASPVPGASAPESMADGIAEANAAIQRWFQVLLMGIVPLQAVASWLFFGRAGLNVAEHHVFNAYVVAHQTLLYVPFIAFVAQGGMTGTFASLAYLAVSMAYFAWAYADFFGRPMGPTLARAAATGMLSYGAYGIALVVGVLAWFAWQAAAG